ncbi:class I SAM-dependent methyltransferase [Haloarcula nitratireducens]|uniref:tRNA(Phe) (4-demethylwyosine(37)-C(7)) aminocarboxypropyltransferase n=1 Tax=Haloarcula nitratireducens TaxID=2487749 RepID=A0AAW4PC48_9EURY|nr:class I SAM-dependent methyltransferase family protein [Halomicroarcula nitratireducens]MBX0295479.1 class I SAM-dependent methyltransferase family protein [Halomicroarcula nitratireducens]
MSERDAGQRFAVVVAKPRTQAVIDALQEEGVYDADRSVRPWDDDSVAIPVTDPPQSVDVREVVRQVGEPRLRGLADHLRERGWTDDELDAAPSSWAVVGSVVLVKPGDSPRPEEVGEALLDLHGEADTVLARGGIDGAHREPDVTFLAGEGDTETVHTEHGTKYALDLAEVMFSPGNEAERVRMGEVVEDGESVLDMFAGIGYFTLPMARAGASVTAVERNPTAFRYLVENAMLNGVSERVTPYRADCRDVIREGLAEGEVDRVVMGYYEAHEYLDSALSALSPGGVVHMHEATPEDLVFERPISRLEAAAADADRATEVLDTRRVKGYSEGVAHVVADARVE